MRAGLKQDTDHQISVQNERSFNSILLSTDKNSQYMKKEALYEELNVVQGTISDIAIVMGKHALGDLVLENYSSLVFGQRLNRR